MREHTRELAERKRERERERERETRAFEREGYPRGVGVCKDFVCV
jgi:hypothetical protein